MPKCIPIELYDSHQEKKMTYLSKVRQAKLQLEDNRGPQSRTWEFQSLHSSWASHPVLCISSPFITLRDIENKIQAEKQSMELWKQTVDILV